MNLDGGLFIYIYFVKFDCVYVWYNFVFECILVMDKV